MKTQLNDLFDQMEPEIGNKIDDKIQVEEDPRIEEILKNCTTICLHNFETSSNLKNIILKNLKAKEITKFVQYMHNNELSSGENFGIYLNEIIRNSPDQEHTLYFSKPMSELRSFGYQNEEKKITIFGDVGLSFARGMISGKIIVNGSTDNYPGECMQGGTLILNGNLGRYPGVLMKGGEIYVKNFPDSTHKFSSNNYEELPNGYTKITSKRK